MKKTILRAAALGLACAFICGCTAPRYVGAKPWYPRNYNPGGVGTHQVDCFRHDANFEPARMPWSQPDQNPWAANPESR